MLQLDFSTLSCFMGLIHEKQSFIRAEQHLIDTEADGNLLGTFNRHSVKPVDETGKKVNDDLVQTVPLLCFLCSTASS